MFAVRPRNPSKYEQDVPIAGWNHGLENWDRWQKTILETPISPVTIPGSRKASTHSVDVKIPLCQNRGLDSDLSGTLNLEISRLNQEKIDNRKITFRLRW